MKGLSIGLMFGIFLFLCCPNTCLAASTIRYALIVGNNQGRFQEVPLKDLNYAEREAIELKQRLIQYGNFDPERTILVTGGGRQEILQAALRLASLHQQDRKTMGSLPTMFAFFFTGHGLSGKLLTADQPLTGADVGKIFSTINATLSLGFFDACFSESLTLTELQGKGAISAPGFNPFAEMPQELLRSEGKIWFVSSRPEEQSYEDKRFGGLFTHYFLQSFTEAAPDNTPITLEQMWEYARRKTEAHASLYGQKQTPVQIVQQLRSYGPIYFSFPLERRATVVFDPGIEGTFVFQYQQTDLIEKVVKKKGASLRVELYTGEVLMRRADPTGGFQSQSKHLTLREDATVRVRPEEVNSTEETRFGYQETPIQSKGELPQISLFENQEGLGVGIQGFYGITLPRTGTLGGLHRVGAGVMFAYGSFSAGIDLHYSWNNGSYEDWGYVLHQLGVCLSLGGGFQLGPVRVDLQAGIEPQWQNVQYTDEDTRDALGLWFGGGAKGLLFLSYDPGITLYMSARLGVLRTSSLAAQVEQTYFNFAPIFEIGLGFPL